MDAFGPMPRQTEAQERAAARKLAQGDIAAQAQALCPNPTLAEIYSRLTEGLTDLERHVERAARSA